MSHCAAIKKKNEEENGYYKDIYCSIVLYQWAKNYQISTNRSLNNLYTLQNVHQSLKSTIQAVLVLHSSAGP